MAPEPLIAQANGHVWEWLAPEARVAQARAAFTISSSLRRPDGVRLRIVAQATPSDDATPCAPDLEDAYLWLLTREGGR